MTDTHIITRRFSYLRPPSLDEAIAGLKEGAGARLLAGGTNLLVDLKLERTAPGLLIDISGIPGIEGIEAGSFGVSIGALTTIRTLAISDHLWSGYTALAEAAAAFGSTQVSARGTIGGNVCNGSPASDTVPALLAFDARAVIAGPNGERGAPVEDLLLGPGRVDLKEGEILTGIDLPSLEHSGSAFLKISRVRSDLAKASAAVVIVRDGDRVVDCRIALGSVGPTALRARKAEDKLIGRVFSEDAALAAAKVASEEISPIDDVRSSADYRRRATRAIVFDGLSLAWERTENPARPRRGEPTSLRSDAAPRRVEKDDRARIRLIVNGEEQAIDVAPNELLLNVLRERLKLTGPKYGCGIGECGACTIRLNGIPTLGCLVLAVSADGARVETVEGLGGDGRLDPIQEAFIAENAFQCGYCTPGMLVMTRKLLDEIPDPTEDEIKDYMKGNQCRCTGYASIVRAVKRAAEKGGS